jgi:hypothetical protein
MSTPLTNREFNEQFLAFCEAKPANETYNVGNTSLCALGQFVASFGCYGTLVGYTRNTWYYIPYPLAAFNAAITLKTEDSTFGKVAERMRTQVSLFDAPR